MAGRECRPAIDSCYLRPLGRGLLGLRPRNDVHRAATAEASELDLPRDQCEQRVVVTAADTETGVEVGAALPDDNLAGIDILAAEALHAKPLRVAVPAVAAGRRALLMCHLVSVLTPSQPLSGLLDT